MKALFKYEIIFKGDVIASVLVHFPNVYGVKPVKVSFTNADLTSRQCEINIMKFIHGQLASYVNRRERAYIESGTYTSSRKLTIDRIRFRLEQCQEGRLLKLIKGVANIRLSLQKIQPTQMSRHHQNYQSKIKPLIDFCINRAERQQIPDRETL